MYLARPVLFLLLAGFVQAALVNDDIVNRQLRLYKVRVSYIYRLLLKECPGEQLEEAIQKKEIASKEELQLTELENEKTVYANLIRQLTECRKAKLAITTKLFSTSTPAAAASALPEKMSTTPPQLDCQNQQGYLKTSIDFVNYRNPSGNKATGVGCDEEDKTQCDIYFEICISHINTRDCSLYNDTTEIIGEGLYLLFSADLGGVPNPLTLDLGDQKWTGVNILVKVWDRDVGKPSDDLVDEFTYDFTDSPGSPTKIIDLESVRKEPKSWLQLTLRNFCPSGTTATATITTTITTSTTTQTPPRDCQGYYEMGVTTSGVYELTPDGFDSFDAWCDFDASHGWTVIQRRLNGSVDFYMTWADYKAGFGDKGGEYWLGNDNIHALTQTNQKLNIYFKRYDGAEASANYTQFVVNAESDNYKLTISGYSGNASDAMAGGTGRSHSGRPFSTHDRDDSAGCATTYKSGWWYNSCLDSNLNGIYASGRTASVKNAVWRGSFASYSTALHRIVMRVTRD